MNDLKKQGAIFLDRDGVIIAEKEFQSDPETIEFIPGSIEGLRSLNNKYIMVVVSNQSGVARGYFEKEDVIKFNRELDRRLRESGISVRGWYFCSHGPDDNCDCRKPKTGMFLRAAADHNIDLKYSWMIGDKTSDIEAGKGIGARTIMVETGFAGKEKGALPVEPDFIAADLNEAISIINALGKF